MSLKLQILNLKITKSQDLLFENGTFPTLEGHQNQTEAHRALDFFGCDRDGDKEMKNISELQK